MSAKLEMLQEQIGETLIEAIETGGNDLLNKIEACLGVASRHSARLANGELKENDRIFDEMEASIRRAREMTAAEKAKME